MNWIDYEKRRERNRRTERVHKRELFFNFHCFKWLVDSFDIYIQSKILELKIRSLKLLCKFFVMRISLVNYIWLNKL